MTRRFLIVEDEPIVALNYAAILQEAGYESVGPVGSIQKGLDLIASKDLDGAVLDIDISGVPVDPIIVALRVKRVPYVFVSAYPERAGQYGDDNVCRETLHRCPVDHRTEAIGAKA